MNIKEEIDDEEPQSYFHASSGMKKSSNFAIQHEQISNEFRFKEEPEPLLDIEINPPLPLKNCVDYSNPSAELVQFEASSKKYFCKICRYASVCYAAVVKHLAGPHRIFFCPACPYTPVNEPDRREHIEKCHKETKWSEYLCPRCGWHTPNYNVWSFHMRAKGRQCIEPRVEITPVTANIVELKPEVKEEDPVIEIPVTVSTKKVKEERTVLWLRKVTLVPKKQRPITNKESSKQNLKKMLKIEKLGKAASTKCPECDFTGNASAILVHEALSHQVFRCFGCDFMSKSIFERRQHIDTAHRCAIEERYLCPHCPYYATSTITTWTRHMEIHLNQQEEKVKRTNFAEVKAKGTENVRYRVSTGRLFSTVVKIESNKHCE